MSNNWPFRTDLARTPAQALADMEAMAAVGRFPKNLDCLRQSLAHEFGEAGDARSLKRVQAIPTPLRRPAPMVA